MSVEHLAEWSHNAEQLEETFKTQKKEYRKYGKDTKDLVTSRTPILETLQNSEELPEFNAKFMRTSVDQVLVGIPDSMPQWYEVPSEVKRFITDELKAMFPDEEAVPQGGTAQYTKKQVRELIDLTCKTCLEATLEWKRVASA